MARPRSVPAFGLLLLVASAACGGSSPDEPDARPVESLFTIAVLADCHLTTNPDKETRLAEAIAWLNAEASAQTIELVAVVGDIGWGAGVQSAKDLLDTLTMPYVPIIGDNEVHGGSEQAFDLAYAPHYAELATTLEGFERAAVPVHDPEHDADRYLQNFSFDYRGLHIVGLDFNDRETFDFQGELAELQDFAGGTMPHLEQLATEFAARDDNSVLLLSHIPMHVGSFDQAEMAALRELFEPNKAKVYANFAGHLHLTYETPVADLYDVYVTAATWVEELPIRLIHIGHDGVGFVNTTEVVTIPSAVAGT